MQLGIKAQTLTFFEIFFQPFKWWLFNQVLDFENPGVNLLGNLNCVAPVGENCGLFCQHNGGSSRAAKAGEPIEAFSVGRQIFTLVLIGVRHPEGVKVLLFKHGSQLCHARFCFCGIADIFKGLKHRSKFYAAHASCATQWCEKTGYSFFRTALFISQQNDSEAYFASESN